MHMFAPQEAADQPHCFSSQQPSVPCGQPRQLLRCRSTITVAEFERLSASLLERMEQTLARALASAGVSASDIHTVERVGGASRTPAIVETIKRVFCLEKDPKRLATEHMYTSGLQFHS